MSQTPPVDQRPLSGPQLSSQEVVEIVEGVDFSNPVVERQWPEPRPPLRMDIFDIPSASRAVPGPSMSCVMPQLGRPDPIPIPESFGVESDVLSRPSDLGNFHVIEERERPYRNFEVLAREIILNIDPPRHEANPHLWLRNTFDAILGRLIPADVAPHDRIGFTFFSASRPEQRPIGLSVRRVDQFSVDVLLQLLERCVQSNEEFFLAGPMRVVLLHVRMPTGGIRNERIDYTSDFHTFCKKKKGIISISNNDNLCLPRALVVAMAFLKKDESPNAAVRFETIKKSRPNRRVELQTVEAELLCLDANVIINENGAGIEELTLFQQHLQDYCITVFSDRRGRETIFEGPKGTPEHPRNHIDLIHGENHFNVITSITGAFTAKTYCRLCKYADNHNVTRHRCPQNCAACIQPGTCESTDRVKCDVCQRSFYGQACYTRHFLPSFGNQSTCQSLKKCNQCLQTYSVARIKRAHVCGEKLCLICNKYVAPNHLCYVQPAKVLNPSKPFLFVFFDFECTQETPVPGQPGCFEHVPNLCISEQVCPTCIDVQESEYECTFCGQRKRVFEGATTVQDFVAYLAENRPQFKDVIALANNFKAYDGQFVLRHMIENLIWDPSVIMNGSKIISLKYSHIQFIDTLNFLLEGVGKMSKTFNLGDIPKSFFPHFFNKIENENYIGPLPPREMYGCDDMAEGERLKFNEWYDSMPSDYVFNFNQELRTYCSRDVLILRLASLKFREGFLRENKVDPFCQAVTIAGACMKVYRTNFLPKDTISVLPPGGYRLADRQSREALCWLMWEASSKGIDIHHAGNGREKVICNYKVDGYSEQGGTKTIWEYHGCFFHGCPLCFKNRDSTIKCAPGETMGIRYEKTLDKTEHLRRNGYIVKEMWSCQFDIMKKQNSAIDDFIKSKDEIRTPPLDPRDSFFGGRTNAVKLYHKVEDDEKIMYNDVCSLYPYVCKYGTFPIKHPRIHIGNDCPQDISNIEGLIKADILPPSDLYHPVLPARFNGKLCFALCRTCAEQEHQDDCTHTDEERTLSGTWVLCEVKKALSVGYTMIKTYEIWEYSTTTYNSATKSGGLFASYINKFLKLKQEATGWPESCNTDTSKDQFIAAYREKEQIDLDPSNIAKNPGIRALSKICLNSFWGKWGQRNDLPHTSIIKNRAELLNLLTDAGVEVDEIMPVSDNIMIVNWHDTKDAIEAHPFTNVVIAAFVTAQARLKLYSYLEVLGQRVLYFDTDSVIFTQKPGQPTIETGEFLGDMTNELSKYGPHTYINEFVSGGPKNYSFTVRGSSTPNAFPTVCKVRGITLSYRNKDIVNFQTLRSMVVENTNPSVVPIPHKIARPKVGVVVTRQETKTFRAVYTKRRRVGNYETLPYGTKRQRMV